MTRTHLSRVAVMGPCVYCKKDVIAGRDSYEIQNQITGEWDIDAHGGCIPSIRKQRTESVVTPVDTGKADEREVTQ